MACRPRSLFSLIEVSIGQFFFPISNVRSCGRWTNYLIQTGLTCKGDGPRICRSAAERKPPG